MARAHGMVDQDDVDDNDLPPPPGHVAPRHQWETDELAAEVRSILDTIGAPPADEYVVFEFQKTLHRGRMFGVDGRGKIILACRCILESKDNASHAFSEPFVSAVLGTACSDEFAGCGLELIEAFDQIHLVDILETMRRLEYFSLSDVRGALSQIVRNKLRRILRPPQPVKKPTQRELAAGAKRRLQQARRSEVERNLDVGKKLLAFRAQTSNNREFGRLRRRHFDIDVLHGAAAMRVARLYANRPEICGNVSWRALVGLSSTTLSDSRRLEFERRIVAGEIVKANEITRPECLPARPPPRSARLAGV